MGTVVAYTRVSTEGQALNGVSLDAQAASIRAYCQAHGLDLAAVYTDAGESAGTLNRPELSRMLEAVEAGDVAAVVVWKLDRLTRRQRDLLALVDRLEAHGAGLRSVSESFDTSTPSGRAMLSMIGTFAQLERETLSERTRAAMSQAKANGQHVGRIPFGFTRTDAGALAPETTEQTALALMATLRSMGNSLRQIAAALNAGGHTTRRGVAFAPSTVRALLNRDAEPMEAAA